MFETFRQLSMKRSNVFFYTFNESRVTIQRNPLPSNAWLTNIVWQTCNWSAIPNLSATMHTFKPLSMKHCKFSQLRGKAAFIYQSFQSVVRRWCNICTGKKETFMIKREKMFRDYPYIIWFHWSTKRKLILLPLHELTQRLNFCHIFHFSG